MNFFRPSAFYEAVAFTETETALQDAMDNSDLPATESFREERRSIDDLAEEIKASHGEDGAKKLVQLTSEPVDTDAMYEKHVTTVPSRRNERFSGNSKRNVNVNNPGALHTLRTSCACHDGEALSNRSLFWSEREQEYVNLVMDEFGIDPTETPQTDNHCYHSLAVLLSIERERALPFKPDVSLAVEALVERYVNDKSYLEVDRSLLQHDIISEELDEQRHNGNAHRAALKNTRSMHFYQKMLTAGLDYRFRENQSSYAGFVDHPRDGHDHVGLRFGDHQIIIRSSEDVPYTVPHVLSTRTGRRRVANWNNTGLYRPTTELWRTTRELTQKMGMFEKFQNSRLREISDIVTGRHHYKGMLRTPGRQVDGEIRTQRETVGTFRNADIADVDHYIDATQRMLSHGRTAAIKLTGT